MTKTRRSCSCSCSCRVPTMLSLSVLVLFWLGIGTTTSIATTSPATRKTPYVVPSFSMADLQRRGSGLSEFIDQELAQILQTTGILAVKLDAESSLHRHVALEGLCECREALEGAAPRERARGAATTTPPPKTPLHFQTRLLQDGHTRRTTLATATVGASPMPLLFENDQGNRDALSDTCGLHTWQAMEALRDDLAAASQAFVHAWDRIILNHHSNENDAHRSYSPPSLLQTQHGVQYHTLGDIVKASTHLEHFHVYSREKDGKNDDNDDDDDDSTTTTDALSLHADAGLFLAFVPALPCAGASRPRHKKNTGDDAFVIQDEQGQIRPVEFSDPANSILIMLGAGAEQWLGQERRHDSPWKATRHKVRSMASGESRAWYGMMHLVPEDAIIQESPMRTFGDMKKSMALQRSNPQETKENIAIGCGTMEVNTFDSNTPSRTAPHTTTSSSRRRLQHVQDPSACNNSTNFFCWMQCLDIPNHEQAVGYVTEGFSLYCLDPAVLASTGNRVSQATAPCEAGWVHNSNCLGSWQPTAPGVYAQDVDVDLSRVQANNEQFCYGGTSMYMDGFHWLDTTCVILLFPDWVLSSQGKLAAGCLGIFVFGILLELVIHQRRTHISHMTKGRHRLLASGVSYGVQLTMGYFVMLAVMTYSGPLFMCAVMGLVFGHVMFNARDALFWNSTNQTKKLQEKRDLEEDGYGEVNKTDRDSLEDSNEFKRGCGTRRSETGESDSSVPEGSTPCCQHTL